MDWRRGDDLHEDEGLPVCFWEGVEKGRDGGAVDVVPAAFALGFEDVVLAGGGVEGEFAGGEAGGGCVEGEDVGEGVFEEGEVFGGAFEEAG